MTGTPGEIAAARERVAEALAEMDRHLDRFEGLARAIAAPATRTRRPGGHLPGTVVTRLTAQSEADVHRAARALGVSVSEFGRRALAQAAEAVNHVTSAVDRRPGPEGAAR